MPLQRRIRRIVLWLIALSLGFGSMLTPAVAKAQTPGAALAIAQQPDGLRVTWQVGAQAASADAGLPLQSYGGYLLPLQTQLVELPTAVVTAAPATTIQLHSLHSAPYHEPLTPAPQEVPPALDWEPLPGEWPAVAPRLPDAPLFILHEGMQRGRHLATVAFSPIYRDAASGEVRLAEGLDATIVGAFPAPDVFADAKAHPDNQALFAPVPALADAPGPTNPLAARSGVVKLIVSQPGIQEVTAAQLSAAGMSSPTPALLRLYRAGEEVPLHIIGSGANLRVRFYAPVAGDRWNTALVYWLLQDNAPGLRMATRGASPSDAPLRDTVLEPGTWTDKKHYQSDVPGQDGDHWFSLIADTQPKDDTPPAPASFSITLPRILPPATPADLGATISLNLTVVDARRIRTFATNLQSHRLGVTFGDNLPLIDGSTDWVVDFGQGSPQNQTRTFVFERGATDLGVTLLASEQRHRVLYTTIDYLLPARLDLQERGAVFQGVDGTWRYQLRAAPADRVLYDITDPNAPQVLTVPDGANFTFQDGPASRRYLVSGEGTRHTPQAVAHHPVTFPTAAHTVYIAPTHFRSGLQPLVNLRRSQGYQARVIDVQSIYDAWSYGNVDPAAIRAFLRYAVGNWNPAPVAAVLVGDGTWDIHDYLGHGNPNVIPPYLADVDPHIGVTACDPCFAQLDGADPLSETAFMTDIWLGRFTVNNETELAGVVEKIVAYETDPVDYARWRSTALHIVDDYIRPDGSLDRAGNFWASVEKLTAPLQITPQGEQTGFQPAGIRFLRHYFLGEQAQANLMASSYYAALAPEEQRALLQWIEKIRPWATSDVRATQERTVAYMNAGVGLVTYTGHANHYYYATLYRLPDGFFNLNDVGLLNNKQTPFIMLSMTCYTAQFAKPDPRPTTLDERLFIHRNGGAIAVWGPAGLSVASGHDKLQEGFYRRLWSAPAQQAKLGALIQAGYNVVSASAAHLDVNKTFLLLGDPLTAARIGETEALWLPQLNR